MRRFHVCLPVGPFWHTLQLSRQRVVPSVRENVGNNWNNAKSRVFWIMKKREKVKRTESFIDHSIVSEWAAS